jgi:hypothetical protein
MITNCPDIGLTDGGKVVSLKHRQRSALQKHYSSASGTRFCQRLSKPQGLVLPDGLGKLKKIWSQTRDLPTFSTAP